MQFLRAILPAVAFAAALAVIPVVHAAADTTPPSRPTGLTGCPTGGTWGRVAVCWDASTDDSGVTGYEIHRLEVSGFVRAASTTRTAGVFSGEPGRLYTVYVVAKDISGNVSAPSAMITLRASGRPWPPPTTDVTPPSAPTGFTEPCLWDFPGTAFCWRPSTDDVGVTAYDVYRESTTGQGFVKAGTVQGGGFTFFGEQGMVTGMRYIYVVVARDAAGNLSRPSEPFSVPARVGLPVPSPSPTA
ncbi:hypothetical protein [Sphaerisporangium sp. TRM90804]|uniref:hypothetical protein n=1 Tax=Sphaerisporangium sp. TRM90804 TaxID=3031113 RepID=UPI00244AEF3E|nr:hypothetical protein [Sphaerisporangium sp. TRM90804]MDH2430744.1 hypothetical protein [Sphaerisporangium sp. TRM90804]